VIIAVAERLKSAFMNSSFSFLGIFEAFSFFRAKKLSDLEKVRI